MSSATWLLVASSRTSHCHVPGFNPCFQWRRVVDQTGAPRQQLLRQGSILLRRPRSAVVPCGQCLQTLGEVFEQTQAPPEVT